MIIALFNFTNAYLATTCFLHTKIEPWLSHEASLMTPPVFSQCAHFYQTPVQHNISVTHQFITKSILSAESLSSDHHHNHHDHHHHQVIIESNHHHQEGSDQFKSSLANRLRLRSGSL